MERSSHAVEGAAGRLTAIADEGAIRDAMARYGHAIDLGDDSAWMSCFAEDGEYDILYGRFEPRRLALGDRHAGGALHKGRAQLAAFIAGHSRPPAGVHKHMLFSPRIEVHGDHATSTSSFIRADLVAGEPVVQSYGSYRDRWRRQSDGRWLIERREVAIDGMRP